MATLASVLTDYEDNADYHSPASTSKAAAFITACRKLLTKLAREVESGGRGGERVAMDPRLIRDELTAAQRWLATATSGNARYFDLSEFRSDEAATATTT